MDESSARVRLGSPIVGAMAHVLAVLLPLLRAQGAVIRQGDAAAADPDGGQSHFAVAADPDAGAGWAHLPEILQHTAARLAVHLPGLPVYTIGGLPHAAPDALALRLHVDDRCRCGVALVRLAGRPPFDPHDHALLQRMEAPLLRVMGEALRRQSGLGREVWPPTRAHTTPEQLFARLSATEKAVLRQLITVQTEKQIGELLGRSPHTVHVHVKNIYRKFDVGSRRQLRDMVRAARMDAMLGPEESDGHDNGTAVAGAAGFTPAAAPLSS